MKSLKYVIPLSILALCCLWIPVLDAASLPRDEVKVLNQIVETLGANWTFGADACEDHNDILPVLWTDPQRNISCDCGFPNNTCHITAIKFLLFGLQGRLPPEIVELPYLQIVDFAYNYLHGSIPLEWGSSQLKYISVAVNKLSGNIPSHLGNISTLTYLDLSINQFSGTVPPELGKLVNLDNLRFSSNRLTGNLPMELAQLRNLTDVRISDNNFNGSIPDFIQNWKQLNRLEIQGSGLKGPIPSSISALERLVELKISDIGGNNQPFPDLRNMTGTLWIILNNCSISGEIPDYICGLNGLRLLDLSFNKLTGKLPNFRMTIKFLFLSGNSLSGNIPDSALRKGSTVDLSYNNFTLQTPQQHSCRDKASMNLNLYRSSSMKNNLSTIIPCSGDFQCPRYWHSININCGGDPIKVKGKTFEGDAGSGGPANYNLIDDTNWAFSTTGDFMGDNDEQNTMYIATNWSPEVPDLYKTARIAPLAVTYVGYCLENGTYTVNLHFAEIQFTNNSNGRRLFDIYIQDKLVEKDFDIEAEASGVYKPVIKPYNATVTNGILEIRLYWAGKGTTGVPVGGVYGPLISAISADPNFEPRYKEEKKNITAIVAGVTVAGLCLILLAVGILCWRCYFRAKSQRKRDGSELDLQTSTFTLKQIKAATDNFDPDKKIGEGGFGPVYKGMLSDGTIIAIKQLSSKSRQGNREFLNELSMISCIQHPNLVKLYGCCIEGDQLLLVYEYLENNSLARALFGHDQCRLKLDWPTRHKICLGIARGLAYLHEESRFKIVHRDIKATNILLDGDLNPKISDFGLAKLDEEEKSHISTRIAGTIGYMAPEYALWGYLTYKADVYSFGVLALEIVSGKNNMSYALEDDCSCLLDRAVSLQQTGTLLAVVDEKLGSEVNNVEAKRMIKVALLCTNPSPTPRPTMSAVVGMLEGTTDIPDNAPEARDYNNDVRLKALRDHHREMQSRSMEGAQSHFTNTSAAGSSSTQDEYDIDEESFLKFKAIRDSQVIG